MKIQQPTTNNEHPTSNGVGRSPLRSMLDVECWVFDVSKRKNFRRAFTMMEIAISLAVIGIALVAIIGILPIGLRAQRDNREKTLVNQDATVFMEMVRNGVRTNAPDADLTNYVFAITNYRTFYNPTPGAVITAGFDTTTLSNNYRIIGLMSTPQYTDANGKAIPELMPDLPGGCYSNHIVTYVHSISGLAVEKPPQGNSLLLQSTFGYRVLCQNLPSAFPFPTNWDSSITYNQDDQVYYSFQGTNGEVYITYWRATTATGNVNRNPTDVPSIYWTHDGYTQAMANGARELRLTFQWPLLPNNNLPPMSARQTYRTLVMGQLNVDTNTMAGADLYFFQPQNFASTP